MKKRVAKQRVVALSLAMLMGMSSLGGAPVYASTDMDMILEQETMSVMGAKQTGPVDKATAEDITKEVSDAEFLAETCMEGIHFDSEKEEVMLSDIKAEDGSAYHPEKPGTYIASYLVIPKDKADSYVITRKVILTDTEGQAHREENGGGKQKEDTESKEDSESHSPNQREVKLTSSNGVDDKESLAELEADIKSGNVMIFSGAENTFTARSTVSIETGEVIYYPSYLGNYETNRFFVNGKIAYCLESHKGTPPSGEYVAQVLDSNVNLQKALYYGYGGAGDITGNYLAGKSNDEKYVYTHIAASYAYAGDLAFTGCNYDGLVQYGVIGYIDYLFGMEAPPKGELSLSKTSMGAVRDGGNQKTPNIKLEGDHRNYITISVPRNVTCHNITKGTSATNGTLQVYGGDTFYLTAPLTVIGSYLSGSLRGSIGETWRTLVIGTGEVNQDIGVFESENAQPVSFSVDWLEMTRIELTKKDTDTKNPLAGAVYGIYRDSKVEHLLMTMPVTGVDGKAVSDYFDSALKTVYVREITAPQNYVKNSTIYKVNVEAGKTIEVSATDNHVTGKIHVTKIDQETRRFLSQADSELAGAVYGLYAKEDIVHPDGRTGVVYKKDSLVAKGAIQADGTLTFSGVHLGKMYVKEITPPEGYTLDTTAYDVTVAYEGQDKAEVVRNLTVNETVKKQAFQLIKISEDGDQTEVDLVKGAGFKVYLVSTLSKVKGGELKPANGNAYTAKDFIGYDFTNEQVAVTYSNGQAIPVPELITDAKGYAISPELAYGLYVVDESTVPENLKKIHPFLINVGKDSREPMQWKIFDDRPFEFLLKIIKKDAQTGNTVLKAGASYKIYDCEKEEYVEQVIQYPKREKISMFTTNDEGYLVIPGELKRSTYRIEEVTAPQGFVRQGSEISLYDGEEVLSALETSATGEYKENPKEIITITVSSNTAYQIDPDTGAVIVEVEQPNDEQVGSLTLMKTGEQLKEVDGESILDQVKEVFIKLVTVVTGGDRNTGIFRNFIYEEAGVAGAIFELHAKDTIYSPDGAKDEEENLVVRYQKDDLVATLTTDEDGQAVINNLPLGTYYLKEAVAGEHFILNREQKEFTLTAENDTQAVVYEGVAYKNERQKILISVEKKDAVSEEPLEGVVFGLYVSENIFSRQGEVLVEKGTLLEKKATDENGKLTFDSDLFHGSYYVKEEIRKPGYLPNEKIWEFEVPYEDQSVEYIHLSKEVENQPTESQFTKTDATTGEELEGARLQIIDKDGTVVEEWISTKEPHIVYALPEGVYTLHEELAPYEEGYVSAADVEFEVKEDGSITEVEMKDEYSKVDISKIDSTTGKELKGAKLQVLDKDGNVLEEWSTNGKPNRVEKLPVNEELTLREITAPDGYEIAEDVKFTLEDTMEIQKVEMKDTRIPESPPVIPKTGEHPWKPIVLLILCGVTIVAFAGVTIRKRRRKKKEQIDE